MLSRLHWGETFCLAVVVAAGTCLYAQDSPTALHAADGNARMMITSIVIPPKPGAPFSATVHADWKRELADGTALPAWLTFDPSTEVLQGTPPQGATAFAVNVTYTHTGASPADTT